MKLSAKSKYGMLGLIDVIQAGSMSVNEIANKHNISKKFLESCFNQMKKGGILISKSGSGGGYRQAKDADDISLYDVLSCLEGDVCIAENDFDGSEIKNLIFENIWSDINAKIEEGLKNISVKDIMK